MIGIKPFHAFEGFIAQIVFHLAGVLHGGFFRNAHGDEEFGNDGFGMLLKKELGKKLLTIKDEL